MLKLPAPRSLGVGRERKLASFASEGGPKPLIIFKFLVRFFLFSILFLYFLTLNTPTNAACGDIIRCNQEIERVKAEIKNLQGQANTLANQIAYLTNQIYLTELEIQVRQAEIEVLSGDIGDLSVRLERIGNFLEYQEEIFVDRARLAYASDQLSSFDIILGAESLDDALRRIKYLRVLEDQDIQSLNEMRDTRTSFNDQKTVLEGKKTEVERLKKEVEARKASLIYQQNAKEELLAITKGQEANYQQYLKQLEAERQSILEALRRGGKKLGDVSRGEWIWPQGSTGCSTDPHIHYEVRTASDAIRNPCNFVGCNGLWQPVTSRTYYTPGGPSNYLTQSYSRSGHPALDLVSNGGVYASESGTAYLVEDTSWKSWCWVKKPYDGPAYGVYIVHPDGRKTVYWHIQRP